MENSKLNIEMLLQILKAICRITYKLLKIIFQILFLIVKIVWQFLNDKPSSKLDKVHRAKAKVKSGHTRKQYQVTIKGTAQRNGPIPIHKSVIMDEQQTKLFRGANRYDAIEGWVRANYPGASIPNIRRFAVEIKQV